MLPVSGAAQLSASGAMCERPVISARGAYSRFVSPAPCSDSGNHRFQSPAARASTFISSITRVGTQPLPCALFASTSAKKRASFG